MPLTAYKGGRSGERAVLQGRFGYAAKVREIILSKPYYEQTNSLWLGG
jgi:hypothetical protein